MRDILQMIVEGRFSPDEKTRYNALVDSMWNHDPFLVASDFDSYLAAQAKVDEAYKDTDHWNLLALRNIACSGFFSSDRTIKGYMADVWKTKSLS